MFSFCKSSHKLGHCIYSTTFNIHSTNFTITCIYTDALYELLSQMISEESGGHDSDPVSSQLSSIAHACLLSLVVGLGDTSKILSAISMMLIGSAQLSTTIQVCMLLICLSVGVHLVS